MRMPPDWQKRFGAQESDIKTYFTRPSGQGSARESSSGSASIMVEQGARRRAGTSRSTIAGLGAPVANEVASRFYAPPRRSHSGRERSSPRPAGPHRGSVNWLKAIG